MIWESCYWKDPLLEAAAWLKDLKLDDETPEETFVRIEKELFFGFYSIRKLFDTLHVSDSTKDFEFKLKWYPNMEPVDHMNHHKIDKLYDLEATDEETKNIRFVCNQIVHSFVFCYQLLYRKQGTKFCF